MRVCLRVVYESKKQRCRLHTVEGNFVKRQGKVKFQRHIVYTSQSMLYKNDLPTYLYNIQGFNELFPSQAVLDSIIYSSPKIKAKNSDERKWQKKDKSQTVVRQKQAGGVWVLGVWVVLCWFCECKCVVERPGLRLLWVWLAEMTGFCHCDLKGTP